MKMKKLISALLAVCLLAGAVPALAVDAGEARAVIGANLTDEQIADVYASFGVKRGDVTELRVTNADERKYLEGYVDESVIGTNSISCVYIEVLEEGEGLDVTTSNINWCTSQMYVSALATAGITDAKIIVAAPFEVSGTAALTGVYMAYEDITGEELDETAKLVSTQELTLTAELADQIGSYDSVEIVNELKLLLGETRNMTDEQLRSEIVSIASDFGVTLTDTQIDQLISLCRALEKLNPDELKEKVESVQNTIAKLGQAKETVSNFFTSVKKRLEFDSRLLQGHLRLIKMRSPDAYAPGDFFIRSGRRAVPMWCGLRGGGGDSGRSGQGGGGRSRAPGCRGGGWSARACR